MKGPWKCRSDGQRGKPKPGFPRCPQPLGITPNVIPTFPPPRLGVEKWKTKSRFPTFPQPLATMTPVLSLKIKNQRKEVGPLRGLHIPYPFSLRSNGTHFMLILRLENAECPILLDAK
jgi:hypothetical protein